LLYPKELSSMQAGTFPGTLKLFFHNLAPKVMVEWLSQLLDIPGSNLRRNANYLDYGFREFSHSPQVYSITPPVKL
jgi:hypothetical protein